ncbi:hypothetical protein B0H14DRAFT_3477833 [Mycena olivaceomarginata]|nr:hypothetical protein B0H14DRAFT_3477833 [Mycena olivaceomarginata]
MGRAFTVLEIRQFDMLVHGVRGNQLPAEEILSAEELEVYGIDWAGLRDDDLLASQRSNNPIAEGASSWVGQVGPKPPAGRWRGYPLQVDAAKTGSGTALELKVFDTRLR